MRITLLRHGKTAFELTGSARGKDLGDIAKSYDLSGIVGYPPRETVAAIHDCSFIVCSQLKRSIESAKALGHPEIHLKDKLFSETTIPHFNGGSIQLPISVWMIILRLMWIFGFSKNGESLANAKYRAKQAAAKLIELAVEHQDVLLVGHGFINHFIAKELRKSGWLGPPKPGNGFWGYGRYERTTI